jgi:uncharacterized protein YchJ
MMGLEELSPLVEEAYKREYVDPDIQDFSDFEHDLENTLRSPGRCLWLEDEEYLPFGNTVEEFANWHGFTEAYRDELDRMRQDAREWLALHGPARNANRNVGRNDPCPCGSGEKYKKCCLH